MQIGDAARMTGSSVRSLRHYEAEGLITPGRCANGHRDYCRTTIDDVVVIRGLLGHGLPIRLIRRLSDKGTRPIRDAILDPTEPDLRREIEDHVGALTRSIDELTLRRDALRELLTPPGPIIEPAR
ncbi:MerR family transcriptional regulator [Gordonia soli]|uniref:Putative MerR family transcriptional regulator n=1 Tax=Gordonia soli NBRC 108243 TaxID=1223545 RepID=M0QED8_9ACTN|nr:MerR family transcriptional regulator [Gordonia soli]GAC66953.1 putative MerR family transcriptional regulator [Gordonia soli NBRC 108243]